MVISRNGVDRDRCGLEGLCSADVGRLLTVVNLSNSTSSININNIGTIRDTT